MALPNNIQNGDVPDANVLMANLNYLAEGKGLKVGSYNALKTFAAAAPSAPFICYASDNKQAMLYTGDISVGADGFIALGGAI